MHILSSAAPTPPADPAQSPASTKTTLATADRCRYGVGWCKEGSAFHDPCSGGWTELQLPGCAHSESIIQIAIQSFDGAEPILVLCPEGDDAATVTSDQLRQRAQAVEDYAPVMRTIADQYDTIMRNRTENFARPRTEDELAILEKYRSLRAQGWSFELVVSFINAIVSPDPVAAMMLLVGSEPDEEIRRQLMAGIDHLVGAL